jgi:hypothetical protein
VLFKKGLIRVVGLFLRKAFPFLLIDPLASDNEAMKPVIILFFCLLTFSASASDLLGMTFQSEKELFQNLEEHEGWSPDFLRQIPIKLSVSGDSQEFLIQSRETCGMGLCPSFIISRLQGKLRVIAYLGSRPKLKKSSQLGFFDLATTQRSGHAKLFEQIQTHYKFNGKIYEVIEQ